MSLRHLSRLVSLQDVMRKMHLMEAAPKTAANYDLAQQKRVEMAAHGPNVLHRKVRLLKQES